MSQKLKVEIEGGNAAFADCPDYEFARILREAADAIEDGQTSGFLRDSNGNKVGTFLLKGKP